MRRRLEKNNINFSTCVFGQLKLHFVQDVIIGYFLFTYKTNMWLKKAEKPGSRTV